MNKKTIIGTIVVVIIIIIVIVAYKNRGSYTNSQTPNTTQSTSQTESKKVTTEVGSTKVTIQNFAFTPTNLTVKKGTTVTFTNEDSVGHSATADDGSFDTGVLPEGQSKTVTFDKVGTVSYHCSVHPNMKGMITVTN